MPVEWIYGRRVNSHGHFAGRDVRPIDILVFQDIGGSVFLIDHGFHVESPSGGRVDLWCLPKAERRGYSALRASSGLTWAALQAGTQAAPIATTSRIVPTRK